jgi:hypothetical protein
MESFVAVPIFFRQDGWHWSLTPNTSCGVVLIDIGGGHTVAVMIDSAKEGNLDRFMGTAMPIIQTFNLPQPKEPMRRPHSIVWPPHANPLPSPGNPAPQPGGSPITAVRVRWSYTKALTCEPRLPDRSTLSIVPVAVAWRPRFSSCPCRL